MTALDLCAIGAAFALCAWVVTAGTSYWSLTSAERRTRRRIFAWLIALAVVCELAGASAVAVASLQ